MLATSDAPRQRVIGKVSSKVASMLVRIEITWVAWVFMTALPFWYGSVTEPTYCVPVSLVGCLRIKQMT
jgi:hypothetical protein